MKVSSSDLQELQKTLHALKNLEKVVKSSSFPGAEALSVADGILLLRHLIQNCEATMKAEKDKASSTDLPLPEVK